MMKRDSIEATRCVLTLALLLASSVAAAHGNPPAGGLVVIDPTDPSTIWLRTNFGIITSDNAGVDWKWLCSEAIGYDANNLNPAVALFANGSAAVGLPSGLSVSADRCDYAIAPTLSGHSVIDLMGGVALSSEPIAADTFDVRLFATTNGGTSWAPQGVSPPSDFVALSLSVSPVDSQRVFLAGRGGTINAYQPVIMASSNGGASWSRHPLPIGKTNVAYASVPDPNDADIVYVAGMNATESFVILRSIDAGLSWQELIDFNNVAGSFALSPDGSQIAVGGPVAGLHVAPTATGAFNKVNDLVVRCLNWTAAGLYACVEPFADGYLLGLSTNDGASFSELAYRSSPCGPPDSCPNTTTVGAQCPALWVTEQVELDACPDGAGGGGGISNMGGAGGTTNIGGTSATGGQSATGGGAAELPRLDGDGCGCTVPASSPRTPWWLSLFALAWFRGTIRDDRVGAARR